MSDLVTIYVDDKAYQVPSGTNLVDTAKFYADNDIPVFCYHPKMKPVGMCRMCLVELGSVERTDSGEHKLDDSGKPEAVRWFRGLQTACTYTVSDGLVVRTQTKEVTEARDDIIEFILTSHPLDCPICDKGGECPLQNLTMRHGPGKSSFYFGDKLHLDKHVPLGELIYLDRERCIQCARCTRFCDEVVDDDVLGFHERGRSLQIVTISDPPFDSKFSGNTTDICPVGALTTADFRFGARPWELKEVPSIDPYGPEGANISLSTRLDRDAGGVTIVKRVMPRQNEYVNEIWISDKTRFGHHHSRSEDRLELPLVREKGKLVETTWENALSVIHKQLSSVSNVGVVAGSSLSNEDLWELRSLVETRSNHSLGLWSPTMTGGDVVAQVGVATGTNLGSIGKGDAILVVASDLEEEAPIWWLRVKQAADRGAKIIVANPRPTKLNRAASFVLDYEYGDAIGAINNVVAKVISSKLTDKDTLARADGLKDLQASVKGERTRSGYSEATETIAKAENVVILCGAEGLSLEQHGDLMQACANLLILTGHVGRKNNGLIPVWSGANIQGGIDLGYSAEATLSLFSEPPEFLIVAGCDPVGEVDQAIALQKADFIVVTSLFETATTDLADVVLPRQSFAERDGTFTSGERRVQRFYTAQGAIGESLPDWKIFAQLRSLIDGSTPKLSTGGVMADITKNVERYAEMSYKNLAQVDRQFPDVGGDDLYYGGTAYQNTGGIGVQWAVDAEDENAKLTLASVKTDTSKRKDLLVVPTTELYDHGVLFRRSEMMNQRIPMPHVKLNTADAKKQSIEDGDSVNITINGVRSTVQAVVSENVPAGVVLLPRRLSDTPDPLTPTLLEAIEKATEPVATEG